MAETITVRWGGPSDATSGSTYRIERTLDWDTWTELAAAQAATAPYVSVSNTLAGSTAHGATSVVLTSGTAFSASGYGWIDDALIQWTGKSTDTLTGVTWHSGYGTYAGGSTVTEAHESYADSTTPTNNAVVYRITHIDAASREGPPTYFWYQFPPIPESRDHCVVIVQVGADLGMAVRSGVTVKCSLESDDQFADKAGSQLDQDQVTANTGTTNDLGLAVFHCWKSSARAAKGGGSAAAYRFTLDTGAGALTVTAATIPDLNWVLLKDIGA